VPLLASALPLPLLLVALDPLDPLDVDPLAPEFAAPPDEPALDPFDAPLLPLPPSP
jgi:hypothetical protein